MVKKVFR